MLHIPLPRTGQNFGTHHRNEWRLPTVLPPSSLGALFRVISSTSGQPARAWGDHERPRRPRDHVRRSLTHQLHSIRPRHHTVFVQGLWVLRWTFSRTPVRVRLDQSSGRLSVCSQWSSGTSHGGQHQCVLLLAPCSFSGVGSPGTAHSPTHLLAICLSTHASSSWNASQITSTSWTTRLKGTKASGS